MMGDDQVDSNCAHATSTTHWDRHLIGLCGRVARAQKSTWSFPTPDHPSLFFNNSFTFPGFAFPPLAFITCPTRKPNTCCLPSLNCSTCPGFLLRASSMIFASAPSSETCVNPFSCTICSGVFPLL